MITGEVLIIETKVTCSSTGTRSNFSYFLRDMVTTAKVLAINLQKAKRPEGEPIKVITPEARRGLMLAPTLFNYRQNPEDFIL